MSKKGLWFLESFYLLINKQLDKYLRKEFTSN